MQQYGYPSTGTWLVVTLRILFWIYVAITFSTAVLQYHLLFTGKPLTLQSSMSIFQSGFMSILSYTSTLKEVALTPKT